MSILSLEGDNYFLTTLIGFYRKEIYGGNQTDVPTQNWLIILIKILLRPFRIFQISAVVLWAFQNYSVYTAIFTLVTIVEISFEVFMKLKVS